MKHMKRKLMSLLLVMAMVATMVPTALAAWDNIELTTDETSWFDFMDDNTDAGRSVYDEIYDALEDEYGNDDYDDYYVYFEDDNNSDAILDDGYGGVQLKDLYEVGLEVGNDYSWNGGYTVYDEYDDDEMLSGDLDIYFDDNYDRDSDEYNITLSTDANDTFDFKEYDDDDDSVYSEIVYALGNAYDREDYYVEFDDEDSDTTLRLHDDSEYDYADDEIDLEDLDELYLDIDPDDDKWVGSYTVYDYDDNEVLYGDITIYLDGDGYYWGDEDIELTTDEWDKFYFDDDNTDENYSVQEAIYDALEYELGSDFDDYDYFEVELDDDRSSDATLYVDDNYYDDYDYDEIDLDDLDYVYLDVNGADEWTGSYTVYAYYSSSSTSYDKKVLDGYITINFGGTGGGSVGDISYTADIGEEVELDVDDFETFWDDYTDGAGTLKSVKFTSVNNGTLCYEHSTSERSHTSAKNKTYYVDPTRTQDSLYDLTFFPTKSGSKFPTGAVSINFTATGTTRSNSSTNKSVGGKITILYNVGDVDDINVSAIGSTMLNGAEFDKVYKDVVGGTSPTYTIQFKNLPLNGTLYYNAAGTSKGTELTSRNLTTRFSNKSNGTNSISKVKYVPGTRGGDTVEYAVYANNKLQYVGKLNFNVQTTVPDVYYSCTTGSVNFKAVDFFNNSNSSIYVFAKPASGTLYTGYGTSAQAEVTSYTRFALTANPAAGIYGISDITYVPAPGYSGTVSIEFAGNALTGGGTVSGSVKITVVPAIPAKDFPDVAAKDWHYAYVRRASQAGIVSGRDNGKFDPNGQLTYGEVLKMVLRAAGYPEQPNGTKHWADNYLALARQKGIVTETNIDLNKKVDRNTMAVIVVKTLGLSPAAGVSAGIAAPTDSTSGHVYALYNTGIMQGESTASGNRFYGSRIFTRAEMAAVACRMMDYLGR